jgi:molybdopterin-containing oxidoreductase family iron-sulfur binding subunit
MPEFPPNVDRPPGGVSRREFMRLAAASAALAGLAGCTRRPDDPILPYVSADRTLVPGRSTQFATAMTIDGDAIGLLVESRDGRPIKIEGNPAHPSSLGAAGVFEQASLLQLYDPDRSRPIRRNRTPATWDAFRDAFGPEAIAQIAGPRGAGLRLLLEPTSSPLIASQLERLRARLPEARVDFYSPVSRVAVFDGTRLAFGRALQPHWRIERADVIAAFDADLFGTMPMRLRDARQFATRRVPGPDRRMARLYVAESAMTVTGGIADHRAAMTPPAIGDALRGLVTVLRGGPWTGSGPHAEWVRALAADLQTHRGTSLVVVGSQQPATLHALACAANELLDNVGTTLEYREPNLVDAGEPTHSLTRLADEMRDSRVRMLVAIDANPVYAAPPDLDFAETFARVPHAAYVGPYENETGRKAGWFVPAAHYLESWGDARAFDGTASLIQPLVAPLFDGRTAAEVLATMLGDAPLPPYRLVRDFWTSAGGLNAMSWEEALRAGVISNTELPVRDARVDASAVESWLQPEASNGGLQVVCPVDSSVFDGRFANNPWLQELPDPASSLTWDNAAYVNPDTARQLQVETGDVVELRVDRRALQAPVFVLRGVADDTAVLPRGYGRIGSEHIAEGCGVNANRLLTSDHPYAVSGVSIRRLQTLRSGHDTVPVRRDLATTQRHWDLEGRPLALYATASEHAKNPQVAGESRQLPTLYTTPAQPGPQWAMAIDLSVCTGCSACVVACQAENNVPVVGRAGVLEHREMHWLRIDRYTTNDPTAPSVSQPMLCQHCENAPCEYVCPVNATVHSPDGLNEMVYNRCVGTRFCSNNCPYKVRRFNWFDYNTDTTEVARLSKNPDVTVRERGVMEKCTFCVQRIREAEIDARAQGKTLHGDDVQTACQQACPTQAIVFGSLTDPESPVAARHREARAYSVLHDLGTRPRVRYLARITNPNDALRRPT